MPVEVTLTFSPSSVPVQVTNSRTSATKRGSSDWFFTSKSAANSHGELFAGSSSGHRKVSASRKRTRSQSFVVADPPGRTAFGLAAAASDFFASGAVAGSGLARSARNAVSRREAPASSSRKPAMPSRSAEARTGRSAESRWREIRTVPSRLVDRRMAPIEREPSPAAARTRTDATRNGALANCFANCALSAASASPRRRNDAGTGGSAASRWTAAIARTAAAAPSAT